VGFAPTGWRFRVSALYPHLPPDRHCLVASNLFVIGRVSPLGEAEPLQLLDVPCYVRPVASPLVPSANILTGYGGTEEISEFLKVAVRLLIQSPKGTPDLRIRSDTERAVVVAFIVY